MKHNCPNCKTALTWETNNPHRPFCSEQCKNTDFIGWSNEAHRIASAGDDEEEWSETLALLKARENQH